jgi:acylphosphatase
MESKVRAHAIITGRVQGVWFRAETKRAADAHGVTGWVRNKRDGSVEAVFEGPKDAVDAALSWCRQGPPLAKVKNIDVRWEDTTAEFNAFEVKL